MNTLSLPTEYLRYYTQVYPSAWEETVNLRSMKGKELDDWPDWCFLPLAGSYAMISTEAAAQNIIHDKNDPLPDGLIADVGNLGALIAWRQTQGIYRFEHGIYQELWNSALEGEMIPEVFYRLPEWGIWIETPQTEKTFPSRGFFAYLEHDVNTKRPELRITLDTPDSNTGGPGTLVTATFHLNQPSIEKALEGAIRESIRQGWLQGRGMPFPASAPQAAARQMHEILAPRVALVLYLCREEANIQDARGTNRQPGRPAPQRTRKGERFFPPDSVTTWNVAVRTHTVPREIIGG